MILAKRVALKPRAEQVNDLVAREARVPRVVLATCNAGGPIDLSNGKGFPCLNSLIGFVRVHPNLVFLWH